MDHFVFRGLRKDGFRRSGGCRRSRRGCGRYGPDRRFVLFIRRRFRNHRRRNRCLCRFGCRLLRGRRRGFGGGLLRRNSRGLRGGLLRRNSRGLRGGLLRRNNRGLRGRLLRRNNRGLRGRLLRRNNRGLRGGLLRRNNRGLRGGLLRLFLCIAAKLALPVYKFSKMINRFAKACVPAVRADRWIVAVCIMFERVSNWSTIIAQIPVFLIIVLPIGVIMG